MQPSTQLVILFVESEPAIRALFPLLLADMASDWRIECAETATEAYEKMDRTPPDVVIANLHMADMDGIEFFKQVRERYPSCARIISSSKSDERAILDSIGIIHQFLPKPCPLEVLKSTMRHASAIRFFLPQSEIRERVSKMERIPSIPSLYLQLVRLLQSPNASIEEISATASKDIEMTAQLLKMVNSAYFGLSQPTSNVADAVSYLGIETVKHLVLAIGTFAQFRSDRLGGISLDALWSHSVRTSEVAKFIAQSQSASRPVIEDSMSAGLLHDVGKLLLASNYPERYEIVAMKVRIERMAWIIAEREVFGFDHAEVGGCLLGLWGLPDGLVDAVAHHHFPLRGNHSAFSAVTAVHVANILIQDGPAGEPQALSPEQDLLYLAKVGITDRIEAWRRDLVDAQVIGRS